MSVTPSRRLVAALVAFMGAVAASSAAPAASVTPLTDVLTRIGQQTQRLWDYLPSVDCTEDVTRTKLDANGKTVYEQKSSYDYLILLKSSGSDISVDESRVEKSQKSSKGDASLLTTDGFSIMALIFHPLYQSTYEFTSEGDEIVAGQRLLRIAFRHVGGNRSPSMLKLGDHEYPLLWKGTAWIDPESYAVVRIQTQLENSMEDVGVLALTADVTYTGIHFAGSASTYWLPYRATIEAATRRQHWRNTDIFTDYRRFDVETQMTIKDPDQKDPDH